MRFDAFVAFFVPAALCVKLHPDALQSRQDGCEAYGDYPEYTGPCEDTNCGAKGTDCTKTSQGCVIYPAIGCPAEGCTCTYY
ncbi:hypothetical protein INS49_010558 [Diaporthe citri]|uniref:uncharacterized protein n=1 Tax=Diaporthe citri TaxID=83186 RepID=UPI001C80D979|nr:uncharacterized protein INS49_010558 [Diaporthe citri]KAG6362328.1 hypothetical protein INS49_010558 [Diaporthe citri]